MSRRAAAFAALHQPGSPLFLSNAWDYASAAVLLQAGFGAVGTTSMGVAAAAGKPDAAGETRAETLALARRLGSMPMLLTIDLEAGFSDDPEEVAELAVEVSEAGAVGINLEDGRPDHTLAPVEAHCAKLAAVKARTPKLFVNARTDSFWLAAEHAPAPIGEAIARAAAYVAAGADGVFVPGAADTADVARLSAGIEAPLNILYLPGRHTFRSLAAGGVSRVSTGSLLFRSALQAVAETARAASTEGVAADPGRPTYAALQEALRRS